MTGKSRLDNIKISDIRPGEVALRGVNQDDLSFRQLADSIKKEGVLNPINVREKTDAQTGQPYYELIDGLQRYTSAKLAGFDTIPAQILDKNDEEVMIAQIVGNAKRVETKPVDFANQIQKIMIARPTLTMAEMGVMLSASPAWLEQVLRLRGLHEQIKPLVNDGHISLANAFVLAKLQPPEEQLSFVEDAQTKTAQDFTGPVLDRVKAVKTANRQGKDSAEAEYVPSPKIRKLQDVTEALGNSITAKSVVTAYSQQVTDSGITDIQSAQVGFQLGLQWALRLDAESQSKAKAEFEAQKKAIAEEKVRRNAERAAKKQQEADERAKKAREEAAAAQTAAAALPQREPAPI